MHPEPFSRSATLASIGEKALIKDFIKPYFNDSGDPFGVGDDCGVIDPLGELILCSTDRVPADLICFRLGILDFEGLGDYLARLNLSDIAASGGTPRGLLLNLGLPCTLTYGELEDFCIGFRNAARRHHCEVLGGDITAASELSASATAVGTVGRDRILTRRNAKPGDAVFASRPIGLTPAAFEVFCNNSNQIPRELKELLNVQFTGMDPMFDLAHHLQESRQCTSCMDNTDGLGQSLTELAEASGVAIVIERANLSLPETVKEVATRIGADDHHLAFGPGADFSLIGTVAGIDDVIHPEQLQIIGRVENGEGVWIEDEAGRREELRFHGWNYFSPQLLPPK